MVTSDVQAQDLPGAATRTLGRHLLEAYRTFGISVGIPGLVCGAFLWVLTVLDDSDSGEGWGFLVAWVLGILVAVALSFVLHIVIAPRRGPGPGRRLSGGHAPRTTARLTLGAARYQLRRGLGADRATAGLRRGP